MNQKIETARRMILDHIKERLAAQGITHKMVAEKNGWQESNVSRMLNAKYAPTLDYLIMLCEAANCFIFVIDKNADDELCELMRNRWGKPSEN